MVYIGFKERLSTIHRQFEAEMAQLFTTTRILPPEMVQQYSRNHNPNVSIFVAYDKRVVKGTDEEVATLDS
jgi:hypothetical protein